MSSITHLSELNSIISIYFRETSPDNLTQNLIPWETISSRYQISAKVLWQCSAALKIEPQKLDEQIYFTPENLKRLEQFIKRIEISWACPNILETCYREKKIHI